MKHFDSKLCRGIAPTSELPPAGPVLTKMTFRLKEVIRLLLALNSHGATICLGCYLTFVSQGNSCCSCSKIECSVQTPHPDRKLPPVLEECEHHSDPQRLFIVWCLQLSTSFYHSVTKIFEYVIFGRLSRYLEHSHLIPANQFVYRKNLGTTNALLSISHKIQEALDCGHEAKVVQVDLSAAVD